ncbi:natural killer cells antigen CD94-like isoform X2 [Dasypus novemcinctus]|uniref:natural killer cells antigen CD94-like isoform X2 n=1 Tax=Dasypus novemcinctus TaxID=9361 RepID=UPI002660047B|nr:natural killer cells antigen CD94-like isoform X2 [Dasypus novemcinctus]
MAAIKTVSWRLISGILGAVCLLLVSTLGILLKQSLTKQISKSTFSLGPTVEPQEGSDCCSCHEKWIGYRCNCYFFSTEEKSWEESRIACASQNSTLFQLENKDELGFLINHQSFYWIGLSYNKTQGAWVREDGSALSPDLFLGCQPLSPKDCTVFQTNKCVFNENCWEKHRYICKQQLQMFHGAVGLGE